DAGDVLERNLQVFLSVELVPAAAKGQRRRSPREPADEQEQAQEQGGEQDHHGNDRGDALEDRFILLPLVVDAGSFEELVQVLVILQTQAERTEPNRRGPRVPTGYVIRGNDFAGNLGTAHFEVSHRYVGRIISGSAQDLDELAVLEADTLRLAVEIPVG